MKELAAYLLLVLAGKEGIAAADVSGVITAAGGEADEEKINSLITELDGKDIHELLAKGDKELKSVVGAAVAAAPTGGSAPAAGGGAAPAAAAAPEKPKEEEVDALDGGMDMFGGGGAGAKGDY